MLKMIKSQNPEKEYPSNLGAKWTDEEEVQLLQELKDNIDIATIAQTHNRTIGGIQSRQREIAYKMHLQNISIDEIIEKTKLDSITIQQTIAKRQNNKPKKITEPKPLKNTTTNTLESEIAEMKNEIKELKNTVKELVNMMKSVIFEHA